MRKGHKAWKRRRRMRRTVAWEAFGKDLHKFLHFFRLACGRAPRARSAQAEYMARVAAWSAKR